jgi:excinuclease UvrABC nuclease subunit
VPERPTAVAQLPAEPGVYRFREAGGRVLYVGRAVDLRRRVSSYWGDLRDRPRLRRMRPRIGRVEALVCDSAHEAAWVEHNLLEHRLPPWNRSRGEEVPVFVELDSSPSAPALRVVHQVRAGVHRQHFGPHLGGTKVRLAVSAVHRVHPLASAGSAASAATRELARLRGAQGGDRAALVDAVTAVLQGDPAAVAHVRGRLAALRDAASAAEHYETAGRLTEELGALEWVVSPQRATGPDAEDADVAGWADGMLLRLELRGGRLRGWEQRAQAEPPSGSATGGDWAPFVQRNAALAAVLARHPVR